MNKTTKEAWRGGSNISPEAMDKRKSINKKILKFGCLPFVALFVIIFIYTAITMEPGNTKYNDPLNIGLDSVNALVGKSVPYGNWSEWGTPETMEGTNNHYWIVYLDSANISFVSDKKTNQIIYASFGKSSAGDQLKEVQKEQKEKLQKHFYGDGSHIMLTKIIKESMNDPKSYDHDSTTYLDKGDHLIVTTSFRGKNAFGALVKNRIRAKTDIETGQVIEIIE